MYTSRISIPFHSHFNWWKRQTNQKETKKHCLYSSGLAFNVPKKNDEMCVYVLNVEGNYSVHNTPSRGILSLWASLSQL